MSIKSQISVCFFLLSIHMNERTSVERTAPHSWDGEKKHTEETPCRVVDALGAVMLTGPDPCAGP